MALSNNNKKLLLMILTFVISLITILFGLLFISSIEGTTLIFKTIYCNLTLFGLAAYQLLLLFKKDEKSQKIKALVIGAIVLLSAISSCLSEVNVIFAVLSFAILLSSSIASRIFSLVLIKKNANRVINTIAIIALVLIGIGFISMFDTSGAFIYPLLEVLLTLIYMVGQIIFSTISKKTTALFMKILYKTHTLEILLGLITLMVMVSMLFPLFEEKIPTFADGMWYCFSLITTIGLGDIWATTLIGRIFSVILGIYGIVVVAIFTSILVNFYNEVKDEKEEEDEKIESKEKHQRRLKEKEEQEK